MLEGSIEKFCDYVNQNAAEGVAALMFSGEQGVRVPTIYFGSKDDASTQAAVLFDALRSLDQSGYKVCYARVPEKSGVGLAVYNRLVRAAGFEVIKL